MLRSENEAAYFTLFWGGISFKKEAFGESALLGTPSLFIFFLDTGTVPCGGSTYDL